MANKVFIDNLLDPDTGDQGFFLGMNTDQCYPGMDLSLKFAEEIKGYTSVWKWIQARIKAGNFYGIHVGDYIPFNCTNSAKTRIVAVVAGIDTYYKYGDQQVGHHIDFISKDLWPTYIQYNLANFNNGLIPVEKLSGDGSKTEFALTKQMDSIDNIIVGSDQVTGYTYDASTFTVTFDEAPAAGTNNITVTGKGDKHPWLCSHLYAFLNSLKMQVPNGTGKDPAVKQVDYSQGGVYYFLPAELKAVIANKRAILGERYSASGVLNSDNGWSWTNLGNLWVPTEMEVCGSGVWGGIGFANGGYVQYPIFAHNMNRVKGRGDGGSRTAWWELTPSSGTSTTFCHVSNSGNATSTNASGTWLSAPVCFRIS